MTRDINDLMSFIIGGAIEVQRHLGPGLLGSTYQACLAAELRHRGLHVEKQVPVRVVYRDVDLECGDRIDLLVERTVVVELKVVAALAPLRVSQVLTYLRLGGYQLGLLLDFDTRTLSSGGIRRVVRGPVSPGPSVPSPRSASGR